VAPTTCGHNSQFHLPGLWLKCIENSLNLGPCQEPLGRSALAPHALQQALGWPHGKAK
jgi:hypothetical protein